MNDINYNLLSEDLKQKFINRIDVIIKGLQDGKEAIQENNSLPNIVTILGGYESILKKNNENLQELTNAWYAIQKAYNNIEK